MPRPETTRFAPSPTGELHLGHAYSAILGHRAARETGGQFLLRMEDLDGTRCEGRFEAAILDDLTWLGLTWDGPVRRQSEHLGTYRGALAALHARGLIYPCFCTRGDIAREVAGLTAAPQGPDGPLYPGTCRQLTTREREARLAAGGGHALRLDIQSAVLSLAGAELRLEEMGLGPGGESGVIRVQPGLLGDLVLGRKDGAVSYHLAVVVDDADQGVTLVTRGNDLFAAAHVQRLLQALLKLPATRYQHHALIRSADGRRLAKRDRAMALSTLRARGTTPEQVRLELGLG